MRLLDKLVETVIPVRVTSLDPVRGARRQIKMKTETQGSISAAIVKMTCQKWLAQTESTAYPRTVDRVARKALFRASNGRQNPPPFRLPNLVHRYGFHRNRNRAITALAE